MSGTVSLTNLLEALRAAGEHTRLRLLAILSRNELTVSELTWILGQSQPRISRHLKLLCDARLLDRHQEGSWVFYRIADSGPSADAVRQLIQFLADEDPELERDQKRLETIRDEHVHQASIYFEKNAKAWDDIRKLYVAEEDVEGAMLTAVQDLQIDSLLDLGTGTGRILEVFSPRIRRGLGIDLSKEMLAVARAKLESADITNCRVRYGDIYRLAVDSASMDVVTIHHVLHFLDDPAAVVKDAVRTLTS
ncbi:MAG: metalloregulator ArsR/SmtB family transcription factor, partial [Arenicellales bacterium]|nr:metalloregulator ArsR/SmtB family transcription factor [Arenicellales bacterium]